MKYASHTLILQILSQPGKHFNYFVELRKFLFWNTFEVCIGHKMSCRNYLLFWKNKNTLTESFHTSHQGNPNWSTGPILDTQSEKIMQEMGLEPTRSCDHRHLKPARLPIPPFLHFFNRLASLCLLRSSTAHL